MPLSLMCTLNMILDKIMAMKTHKYMTRQWPYRSQFQQNHLHINLALFTKQWHVICFNNNKKICPWTKYFVTSSPVLKPRSNFFLCWRCTPACMCTYSALCVYLAKYWHFWKRPLSLLAWYGYQSPHIQCIFPLLIVYMTHTNIMHI